jgi:hypothetical protein
MNKNNSHMKTLIRTIACLGVLGLMASCQMYEIDTQMTPEKQAASIRMVCDALPSYTVASTDANAVTFNVSSNTPWTITRSSGADWCTVTPSSSSTGALISDVVVTFQDNATAEDRKVTLTLKGDKVGIPVTIDITQNRLGRLFVTPIEGEYAATGGPLTFSVQTNVAWEVHSSAGWLTFNRESGEPDPAGRTFTIIATAAPSQVLERTATVTVKAGDEEESFDVTQKGIFDLTEISDSFFGDGDTKFIKMRTDLPWTIMADKDWLLFDEYSGTGDGSLILIEATALPNEGMARKANITVTAGGVAKTFEVAQDGAVFEIVAPASTEIKPTGEEILLEVKSSLAWEVSTDVDAWAVEKADANHIKLTAPFHNTFAPRKGHVTIKGPNAAEFSLELTQDINFTISEAEVLEDGSVKVFSNKKSRVIFKDEMRYVSVVLKMGEVSVDDNATLCLCTHDAAGDSELQCQIYLAGNKRLRTNGGHTTYGSTKFDFTKDELAAIQEYRVDFRPNAENAENIDLEFFYNGTSKKVHTSTSPFKDATATAHYFFGTEDAASGSEAWFIIKSCTPTLIAE